MLQGFKLTAFKETNGNNAITVTTLLIQSQSVIWLSTDINKMNAQFINLNLTIERYSTVNKNFTILMIYYLYNALYTNCVNSSNLYWNPTNYINYTAQGYLNSILPSLKWENKPFSHLVRLYYLIIKIDLYTNYIQNLSVLLLNNLALQYCSNICYLN